MSVWARDAHSTPLELELTHSRLLLVYIDNLEASGQLSRSFNSSQMLVYIVLK